MALKISNETPWQDSLSGSKNKLNALFHDGHISDLTVRFPGKEIEYKAHKVILAMASSAFEPMLFGPMAITGSVLELSDDDPKAFKIVLAHCYEVDIEPSDLDEALEVYLMADKYFLDELTRKCLFYIREIISSENINKVVEFSAKFNFNSLMNLACCDSSMYSDKIAEILLLLSEDQRRALLETDQLYIDTLVFTNSWQCPQEILDDSTIIHILSSNRCTIKGLYNFSGCVSAEVVRNISWASVMEVHNLRISFANINQANDILRVLGELKLMGWLNFTIHLQCNVIRPEMLEKLPKLKVWPSLFFSDVDDTGIDYVISTIKSLKNDEDSFEGISFPKSNLTLCGLKTLIRKIATIVKDFRFPNISVCSPNIPSNKEKQLEKWIYSNLVEDEDMLLQVHERQELMQGWDHLGFEGSRAFRLSIPVDE